MGIKTGREGQFSRPWTPDEEALLGTIPDKEAAAKMGRTMLAVRARRYVMGIPVMRVIKTRNATVDAPATTPAPDPLASLWAEIQALDPSLRTPADAARFAAALAVEHLRPRTIGFSLDAATLAALDLEPNRSAAVREAVDVVWDEIEAGAEPPSYTLADGPKTPVGVRVDGRTLRRIERIAEWIGLPRNRSAAICLAVARAS